MNTAINCGSAVGFSNGGKANESALFLSRVLVACTLHIYEYGLLKLGAIATRHALNVTCNRNKNAYSFLYYHSKLCLLQPIFLVGFRLKVQRLNWFRKKMIASENVAVESVHLLLRWCTISAFTSRRYNVIIVTIIRAVARSFPERCNLERFV